MKTFLALIGALGILGALVAAVFFFGGFFDVAGTVEEPKPIQWVMVKVREASISRHATERPPMDLNNAEVVKAGARGYATRGCVNCHGGPGESWQKFADGLNPPAADLHEIAEQREPREIFYVIKNGIKMTGMPGFAASEVPDQEIWSIVAFIKKGEVAEADYKAWTAPPVPPAPPAPPATTPAPGGTPLAPNP
jgi:mono/diheme cytochrome c family protein